MEDKKSSRWGRLVNEERSRREMKEQIAVKEKKRVKESQTKAGEQGHRRTALVERRKAPREMREKHGREEEAAEQRGRRFRKSCSWWFGRD